MEAFAFLGMIILMLEPTLGPAFPLGGLAGQISPPTAILWGFRVQVPAWGPNVVRLRLDRAVWKLRPEHQPPARQDEPRGDYRSIALDHLWGAGARGWYGGVGLDRTRWNRDSVVGRGSQVYQGETYPTEDRVIFSKEAGWGGSAIVGRSWKAMDGCVWVLEGRVTLLKGMEGRTETIGGLTIGFAFRPWESSK